MPRTIVEIVAAACALFGAAFYFFCMISAWRFLRQAHPAPAFSPPVSILKPLRGADPRAYECLRSHCLQDYPEYEIIFGVHDPQDPAVPLIERLMQEFPQRQIRLVVCPQLLATNRKVSNLIQMLPAARYDCLLVNDGDIRVPPDYLRRILAPLAHPRVGLVTALYRPVAGRTLGSRLEALSITDFAAAVLVSYQSRTTFHYGFGSTLAFSRDVLKRIGGLEALSEYLADDHQLGTLIAAAGYEVVLSDLVVDTALPDYSLREFWNHQLRWARTVRDASPRGNLGIVLVFGVQWAAVALVTAGGAAWSWGLFAAAYAARIAALLVAAIPFAQDRAIFRRLWLLPLRDLQAVLVWVAAYAGRTVTWRGERYLLKKGKLFPLRRTPAAPGPVSERSR